MSDEPTPLPAVPASGGWQDRPPQAPWLPPELSAALGPLLDGFDYRDHLEICEPALPGWRVLAGTRRGRLHAHHGTHREDAFCHGGDTENGRFWIFCVCDGAGSSRLSRVGAEVTCRRLVAELSRVFHAHADAWAALPSDALKSALETAVEEAVRETAGFLATLAAEFYTDPKDFRCTLLLTILYRHGDAELACLSQVGDGFLAGINRQGIARRYGPVAAPGGFSGEVNCFVPDEGCALQARPFGIIPSTANLDALLLCTDGIEDPFYPVETNIGPLFGQFLTGPDAVLTPDPELSRQHLAAWLAFEKKGENDDRTAFLVYRDR